MKRLFQKVRTIFKKKPSPMEQAVEARAPGLLGALKNIPDLGLSGMVYRDRDIVMMTAIKGEETFEKGSFFCSYMQIRVAPNGQLCFQEAIGGKTYAQTTSTFPHPTATEQAKFVRNLDAWAAKRFPNRRLRFACEDSKPLTL